MKKEKKREQGKKTEPPDALWFRHKKSTQLFGLPYLAQQLNDPPITSHKEPCAEFSGGQAE